MEEDCCEQRSVVICPLHFWSSPKCCSNTKCQICSKKVEKIDLQQYICKLKEASESNSKVASKKLAGYAAQVVEQADTLGQTALMFSIAYNRLDFANSLLKAGARVDFADNSGQTALHVAINKGLHNCVKFLLSRGAKWFQRDNEGVTALHLAAMHPSHKSLTLILKEVEPGEVDSQDSCKKTALHWSAAYGNTKHIQLLLSHGANVCIPDDEGRTPLHWAAVCVHPTKGVECLRILLEKEPSCINWQDYEGRSVLHLAVSSGTMKAIEYLTSNKQCNLNILNNIFATPLHVAAKQGFVDKLCLLLDRGADYASADNNGATALHYAAHCNHIEVVKAMLSRLYVNDVPDSEGCTALIWAAARNSNEVLSELVRLGGNLDNADFNGCTALHTAALNGNFFTTKLLLALRASFGARDKAGMTPLLKACEFGRTKVVDLLIRYGSHISSKDKCKRRALHWAAKKGFAYLCQVLINHKCSINRKDIYGMTPLHYATTGGYENCVAIILDNGGIPDIPNKEGKTPLHIAAAANSLKIVKILCRHDAFMNALTLSDKWRTPLDYAVQCKREKSAIFMRRKGGLTALEIEYLASNKIQKWFLKVTGRKKLVRKTSNNPIVSLRSRFDKSVQTEFEVSAHVVLHCNASVEERAAFIIQSAWHRYSVKRKLLDMRRKIQKSFSSPEDRKASEKEWKDCLQMFLSEL